jgi:organic hydroperoxide reductase OsmC/OhrA
MSAKPREFRYAIELAPGGKLTAEDGATLDPPDAWTPEHLLLAALARCSLDSLRHHAKRAGIEVALAAASAHALVTRRESDGRYAVVEAALTLEVGLEPRPDGDALDELLAKAERDCFVGASLTAKPSYTWKVG